MMATRKPTRSRSAVKKASVKKPTRPKKKVRTSKTPLKSLLLQLRSAKHELAEAQDTVEDRSDRLIGELRTRGQKTSKATTDDGIEVTGTLVEGEQQVIDEDGLRKELGAKVYDKLTTRKLDRKLLDAAVASGDVQATLVAKHTTIKPKKAYVRLGEPKKAYVRLGEKKAKQ